jgi:cell wall-associated NlpC family hydrolase
MRKFMIAFAALALFTVRLADLEAAPSEGDARKRIIETAVSLKGVPYVYGAESPSAFDCSGFVQYVYAHAADLDVPRNSRGLWSAGMPVERAAAKPGDIFVFDTAGGGGPSHVAIYLGEDKIIHAVSEGPTTGVVVSPISDRYFGPRFIGARYFIVSAASAGKPAASVAVAAPAAATAPAAKGGASAAAAPSAKPAAPAAAPAPAAAATPARTAPVPSAELIVSQVGFVLKPESEVFIDKIPAATGTAIAFTISNGTGKDGAFHILFYKADVDFSKTKILREERASIKAGASREISAYTFTEPGVYRLNVKTADNTQLMQRTWKVVDIRR